MGFFAEFNTWLNGILSTYIATNTARIATLLEPTVVTLAVLYVMIWGYLHLMGQIEEPFTAGIRRFIVLAVVLGASLDLWLYNQVIVDTFFNAPSELAAGIVGAYDPVAVVDQILFSGGDAASLLLQKGGVFHGSFTYDLAGVAVYLIVGVTVVYTMFLLALSRIALSVLLALGPLFIALLFFQSTKRFFEAWIAQLANYALITILTVLLAALMMTVVSTAAQQAVSTGGTITIAEAARVCVAAGLTFLVMRQVMPMAAGLASGLALSTFGVVSAAMIWGLGRGSRRTGGLSRTAGHALQRGAVGGWRRLTAPWRENTIQGGRT